jgi:hypothetical protein
LGNRVAAAAWADNRHDVYALFTLQSTDNKAATAGRPDQRRRQGEVGFTVHDGWALVAVGGDEAGGDVDGQGAADAAGHGSHPAEQKELDTLLAKPHPTEADPKRIGELLGMPVFPGTGGKVWDDLFGTLSGALVTLSAADITVKPAFRAIVELAKATGAKTAKQTVWCRDRNG